MIIKLMNEKYYIIIMDLNKLNGNTFNKEILFY